MSSESSNIIDIRANNKYAGKRMTIIEKSAKMEIASTYEEGDSMTNESMNVLFNELKADMREREQRTKGEVIEREKRFEKQLADFNHAAERREERFLTQIDTFNKETKEREERLNRSIDEIKTSIITFQSVVNQSIQTSKEDIKTVANEIKDTSKHVQTLAITSIAALVAVTMSIAALVITLYFTIK
ncbi:hypothetical protein [Lysinibacillus sp. RC79]|uniref:hypothetical protein n=1 Tax=Lysinibacillus sp. RC79 TaxID=3156296 RepID=UPI003518B340